jgi:serine/threonine protein kinase
VTAAVPAVLPARVPGAIVGGKYRLVRKLGAGGMGEVWAAENRDTGAEIAVKMATVPAEPGGSSPRFQREARLAAMLAHRGVVRIFDLVEEADGTFVLVMELLRGETLEHYALRRGPLSTREATAIVVPVLQALAHAHDAGIVHRDVTPANVFLAIDPDGLVTPKLLDFGIAKVPAAGASHTVDGRALGTPRYMAPERIREPRAIDGRSDVFSVGVVLYELLTGVCPFAASTPAASLAAVLEAVVDPDPRIEPKVWLEVRRSLSKRPYERQASALAMAVGLRAASGETDASLNDVLRQLRVCLGTPLDSGADPASPGPITRALDGHSIGAVVHRDASRRRVAMSVAGALVLVGLLAVGAASLRPRPATATAPLAPPPAQEPLVAPVTDTPVQADPAVVAPVASPAGAASAPVPTASAAAAAPRAHVRPRPVHPKPVAVTPGF